MWIKNSSCVMALVFYWYLRYGRCEAAFDVSWCINHPFVIYAWYIHVITWCMHDIYDICMTYTWYMQDLKLYSWYIHDTFMLYAWYIIIISLLSWYMHDIYIVHTCYKHGIFMIYAWYSHCTFMIYMRILVYTCYIHVRMSPLRMQEALAPATL